MGHRKESKICGRQRAGRSRGFDGGELSGLSRLYAPGPAVTAEGSSGCCRAGAAIAHMNASRLVARL